MQINPAVKILILESQIIIAADISLQFSKLGYDVSISKQCTVRLFIFTVRKIIPTVRTVALKKLSPTPTFKASCNDQYNARL